MTGRRILRLLPVLAATLLLSVCSKTPTLNLLVWEGYADPSFIKAFEEQNHCKVTASYMGSSDELMAKLRGGSAGNYDVISPSSDVATSITTSGLAAPSISRRFRATANFLRSLLPFLWCARTDKCMACHSCGDRTPLFTTRPRSRSLQIRGA